MKSLCVVVFLSLGVFRTCPAGVIFDLRDQAAVFDGKTSALFSMGGIEASFIANGGDLNSNVGQFGINAAGGADDADAVDSGESLSVSFDQDVFLTRLDLEDFTGSEQIDLTIGLHAPVTLINGDTDDVFTFASNHFVAQGQSVLFEPSNGDFGIATFTVAAVPEPHTFCVTLMAILAFLGPASRRRPASY
ncbi:MAG: hypothetical protein Fues2KO_11440 [Fuerstiella sp.]